MPLRYSVFGLQVWSNLPIPGLVPISNDGPVDVRIELGQEWRSNTPDQSPSPWFESSDRDACGHPGLVVWKVGSDAYYRFLYRNGPQFTIDPSGCHIEAAWLPPLTLQKVAAYLLGPILGFVLRLRGVACLHSSAVAIGEQAIALVGPAGAGKSVTAAAFATLGCPVLSDDKVALTEEDNCYLVQPGYPRLHLWPAAAAILFGSEMSLPRIAPDDPVWDKCYLDLGGDRFPFQARPLPLAAIFFLVKRSEERVMPLVQPIGGHAGMVTLAAHIHQKYLPDPTTRARDFDLVSRVVQKAPLYVATPHTDSARLPQFCQAILAESSLSSAVSL